MWWFPYFNVINTNEGISGLTAIHINQHLLSLLSCEWYNSLEVERNPLHKLTKLCWINQHVVFQLGTKIGRLRVASQIYYVQDSQIWGKAKDQQDLKEEERNIYWAVMLKLLSLHFSPVTKQIEFHFFQRLDFKIVDRWLHNEISDCEYILYAILISEMFSLMQIFPHSFLPVDNWFFSLLNY